MRSAARLTRRFRAALLLVEAALLPVAGADRPLITHGVASGDVTPTTAIIWSRADRPARMIVEWSEQPDFSGARRVTGPRVDAASDFTGKTLLEGLPPGVPIFYRVRFATETADSEPVQGRFLSAPADERDILFAWSGDTCGQGFGIDLSRGGFRAYASLLAVRPDFFIHSGDNIYADNPIKPVLVITNEAVWTNVVMEGKHKVAETLDEFRANYRYNLLDQNLLAFNAATPTLAQWDDHEVRNNWYPGQVITNDKNYQVKEIDRLLPFARQAFFEYLPIRPDDQGRIYRHIPRGPLCDVFLLDERSYRGPNSPNRQPQRGPETAFLGDAQLAWLKQALLASRAAWKIIAADMPLGLVCADGKHFENCANGDGPPLGRELEFADLLGFLKKNGIRNVVWLTADVHYAASHYYSPAKAVFKDFDPFWEFVSGPLHAGAFGPGKLDNTFGPEVIFSVRKKGDKPSGPHTKNQFFSTVAIAGQTKNLTVTHYNRDGEKIWEGAVEWQKPAP